MLKHVQSLSTTSLGTMDVLIGKTGFVGGHLVRKHRFDLEIHRANIELISGANADVLVCAGIPAQKWIANQDPVSDWQNISNLAQVLTSLSAKRAVLVSTVDVYDNPYIVDEDDTPSLNATSAYGRNRTWFEFFFRAQFPESLILRLPALYASDVRKNLVHDLLHGKSDQWEQMNPNSTFQFFDTTQTWSIIQEAWRLKLSLVNVTSEPVTAQQIANLFGVSLGSKSLAHSYDVRSRYADEFGGSGGYFYSKEEILKGIASLRDLAESE